MTHESDNLLKKSLSSGKEIEDIEVSLRREGLKLKKEELRLQEYKLRNERFLGSIRIVVTGVVVILIPAILGHQIQRQQVEIETLKSEIDYLERFSDKVAEQEDLVKRRNYVDYLASIAHSKSSRERWKSYLDKITDLVDKQKGFDDDIAKYRQEIDKLREELGSADSDNKELSRKLNIAKQNLINVERERQRLIESTRLSNLVTSRFLPWGIVIGADKSEAAATDEVLKAELEGFENVYIFLRSNSFRTVIGFNDSKTASQNLTRIKQTIRDSSYGPVDLNTWCLNPSYRGSYFICQ